MSWDDIVLGNREERERARSDEWWLETERMVSEAYDRYWRRRGMIPPPVSNTVLMTFEVSDKPVSDDDDES